MSLEFRTTSFSENRRKQEFVLLSVILFTTEPWSSNVYARVSMHAIKACVLDHLAFEPVRANLKMELHSPKRRLCLRPRPAPRQNLRSGSRNIAGGGRFYSPTIHFRPIELTSGCKPSVASSPRLAAGGQERGGRLPLKRDRPRRPFAWAKKKTRRLVRGGTGHLDDV